MLDGADAYWLKHETLVWAPFGLRHVAAGKAHLECEQEECQVAEEELQGLEPVQVGQLCGVEDLCTLSSVSEAALLHTLRVRYYRRCRICVSFHGRMGI